MRGLTVIVVGMLVLATRPLPAQPPAQAPGAPSGQPPSEPPRGSQRPPRHCGLGPYLETSISVGAIVDGGGALVRNALGLRAGRGCATGRDGELRLGLFLDGGLGAFQQRADAIGLELEAGRAAGLGVLSGRLAAADSDAAGIFTVGGRWRRGPLVVGIDVMYFQRSLTPGESVPARLGIAANVGVSGKLAIIPLLAWATWVALSFDPSS